MHDPLLLIEDGPEGPDSSGPGWHVLVVDDDPEVHAVTRLAVEPCRYDGRRIDIISAHSAAEARTILQGRDDIALILLDVVMETDQAGLDLVPYIRETLMNRAVRIVLRTGQPGQAPAREVVERYDIDDYRTKTELTFERFYILVMTALRTFKLVKELESQQRQLQQANHELERFAYVASHDLQTPLRGIVGFTQLLQQRIGASLEPDSAELLQGVLDSGRQLHHLIASLLQFARLGRAAAKNEPVALDAVLQQALTHARSMLDARNARVESTPLPTVNGDAEQLELLFRNLIENGIKFQTGDAPTLRIEAVAEDACWLIRFIDQGIGIDAHQIERIFEPFHRLHTSDAFPGSGLGLAVARRIALMHGGSLHAESMLGQGTTMSLRLPRTA
ncbi:response regulator [Sinimarinibacterium sp. CAU 1509]|uniref:sensor histidine kinase n=1 Tax=Sinimarinibacterium sp. CAU 1509 TaxID=2562283 RepID=UPI0010AD9267|nr:ATP-binding protein [Sinimarinibacterium sp. CAU 1509]TJY64713.1 response regulator [Sinimarinibacterium sp. CAU 1509]